MAVRSLLAPWPGKVGRRLTVLGPAAAAEYAAAVSEVALAVELALDRHVHGGRVARFTPLEVEPWVEARARHRRIAVDLALGAGVALRLDVADCYRSIRAPQVDGALRAVGAPAPGIAGVLRFLERTSAAGIPGLPVGPEPSVVLANAVLRALDLAVGEGVGHLRWYDDILLLGRGLGTVLGSEVAIGAAAGRLGLRLHPGKRRIAVGSAAIRRLILGGIARSCAP